MIAQGKMFSPFIKLSRLIWINLWIRARLVPSRFSVCAGIDGKDQRVRGAVHKSIGDRSSPTIIFSPMGHSLNGPYWEAAAKRGTWVHFSGASGI